MGSETMGSYDKKSAKLESKGFTLIASLLLLVLLSGMSIGLMMMVNTEQKVGGTDLQNNVAFHTAEGGIETMESNLVSVFQSAQSPTAAEICAVSSTAPTLPGVTWKQYTVVPGPPGTTTCPSTLTGLAQWGTITGSGQNAGLQAQIIPVNMMATASLLGGQEVSMVRGAEVALIPVFQFGVFCEGDCAFFSSPNLDFVGRIHTNADLYVGVASGYTLTFHSKLDAYGNIVTEVLPNGLSASSNNDTGTVYIPKGTGGCDTGKPNCGTFTAADGSVTGAGGAPPSGPLSAQNANWPTVSTSTFHSMIIDGDYGNTVHGTGAKKLSMPFVDGTHLPYEIIRRPLASDSTALTQSREYNLAQIRVLLSDDPADLPGGASDVNNVRLANVPANASGGAYNLPYGIATSTPPTGTTVLPALSGGSTYNTYFATASNAIPVYVTCNVTFSSSTTFNNTTWTPSSNCVPDWPYPPAPWTAALMTGVGPTTDPSGCVLLCPLYAPYINSNGGAIPAVAPQSPALSGTGTSVVTLPTFYPCPPASPVPAYLPASPLPVSPCVSGSASPAPYYAVAGYANGSGSASAAIGTPAAASTYTSATWNLIDGWLRVEYVDASGTWHPVTNEWLGLGFARDVTPPTATTPNKIHPNAILLLQQPADRLTTTPATLPTTCLSGAANSCPAQALDTLAIAPACTATNGSGQCKAWNATPPQLLADPANPSPVPANNSSPTMDWVYGVTTTTMAANPGTSTLALQSPSRFNWYPINFYDAREGEVRDSDQGNNTCTTNGMMNAVEIDVGNLQAWLQGTIGTSGTNVDYVAQNGYVLYFSDRRGMLYNPNPVGPRPAGTKSGDSGLEDTINSSTAGGAPDGLLEPIPAGHSISPEDVNQSGLLDAWGNSNLGLAQYGTPAGATQNLNYQTATVDNPNNPYSPRIASCTLARKNWVSGARHVLKLVDGSLGNLPISPTGGGFTVASENPVYVQGDYNSSPTDTFFSNGTDAVGYVPAAVIADAVTILSDNWDDRVSTMGISTNTDITYAGGPYAGNRIGATTYYRMAIASGKNLAFPFPSWETGTDYGFGTDGGIHNFLRFLEDWTGQTLHYSGSLVSLYYATYNTGTFKCCTYIVYSPPSRDYQFDNDFTKAGGSGLPPGTPMFRDVDSLSYRQMFTARTD
ncbi:MAG: hypothetical protein ACLPLR_07605 [Terriglobales bacterium]